MNLKTLRHSLLALCATAALFSGTASAQTAWPTKPVRIIVSTAAGGASVAAA